MPAVAEHRRARVWQPGSIITASSRVNPLGRAGTHKTILLAAVAYNLKRLLQHLPKQRLGLVVALPKPPALLPRHLFSGGYHKRGLEVRAWMVWQLEARVLQ